jgi:peptide-methionine (R)-S-oxide reductase
MKTCAGLPPALPLADWLCQSYLLRIAKTRTIFIMSQPKITKSDAVWRDQLTAEQYHVTRKHGTERAFTGPNWDNHEAGMYNCICCGKELFDADTKFDSGTGWPSFYAPVDKDAVAEHVDRGFFTTRTEVRCADCDAHLGHVFNDGPKPTGLRYCMNGQAMGFEKKST